MKCFARWHEDRTAGVCFRDQTILQFGDSWELIANLVLLNPGSALPMNSIDRTAFLQSQKLAYFVAPSPGEKYLEFSVDPLMRGVMTLFREGVSGGAIKLYNLFNLKNQHSSQAIGALEGLLNHPKNFSLSDDIIYCNAPVVVASGGGARQNDCLRRELIRHVSLASRENLYCLSKSGPRCFAFTKAEPDRGGFIDSYHPSYTFKYGNTTSLGCLAPAALTRA